MKGFKKNICKFLKNKKMKNKISFATLRIYLPLLTGFFVCVMGSVYTGNAQAPIKAKNIILVHGAFADGSGWEEVYNILSKKGYNVTIVQNPCSSLEDDV